MRHGGARRGGRAEGGDWKPLPDRRDGYEVEVAPRRRKERRAEGGDRRRDGNKLIEVAPRRHEESRSTKGEDRRQEKDKKERRQRRKEQDEPVIVYAEPRRGKTYPRRNVLGEFGSQEKYPVRTGLLGEM